MGINVVFRVDASLNIGTGHVARCLTLASHMKREGVNSIFVTRQHDGNLISRIAEEDCEVRILKGSPIAARGIVTKNANILNYESWLGASWESDAEETKALISDITPEWLIVDHYALDNKWESTIKPFCTKIMAIDDLANRKHNCDLLVDQSLGRQASDYNQFVPQHCKLLLGPEFSILRRDFSELRASSLARRSPSKLESILVFFGGIDQNDVTSRVLDALAKCPLSKHVSITVVLGKNSPNFENVRLTACKLQWNVDIIVDAKNMANLMAESDLTIGAAGGTAWERCCLGLPSIVVSIAKNQDHIAKNLQVSGAAILISMENMRTDLFNAIENFQRFPEELEVMSKAASSITNGEGAQKVVQYINSDRQ